MSEKNKLLGLEVMRFVAACIVLFVHYHFLCDIGIRRSLPTVTLYPFYHNVPFIYSLSEWSVRVFWSISGFIFFWKYQPLIAQGKVGFRHFLAFRFARLYPLHLLTLVLVMAGQAAYVRMTGFHFLDDVHYSAPHFLTQLFMAGNRIYKGDSFNWPVWSVSVELAVYLLFYLVTRHVTRSMLFNILVIVMFVFIRLFMPNNQFFGLWECLLFFYIGGAASILKKTLLPGKVIGRLAWITAGLVPLVFWITGWLYSPGTIFIFWSLWLPVLLYCLSDDFKVDARVRKAIEVMGNMTYASYLIHIPVLLMLAIISFRWKILLPVFNPLFLAGYLGLIFILSYLIYKYLELPVKDALKAAVMRGSGQSRMKPLYYALLSAGFLLYACLAFTPAVARLDRGENLREAHSLSELMRYTKLGQDLFSEGRDPEAIAVYQKANAIYPFNPIVYADLGSIYARQGNYAMALENFDKTIAINPNYFQAYNNRGFIHDKQGHLDLAMKDLLTAKSIDPCPDSFLALKKIHKDIVNYAMVSDDAQKAICRESALLYSNLGSIYSIQNDNAQAVEHFNKALARDPGSAKAYSGRAICYFNTRNFAMARKDAQIAVKLGAKVDPRLLNIYR